MKKYAFFKKRDIFVYAALIVLTVLLFVLPFGGGEAEYFEVVLDGEIIYSYDCRLGKGVITGDCEEITEKDRTLVIVERNGNRNVISFCGKRAEMVESNCPNKECIESFAPLEGEGVIVCLPHRLKIVGHKRGSISVPSGRANEADF